MLFLSYANCEYVKWEGEIQAIHPPTTKRSRYIPSKSTFRHAVSEVPAVCESSDRCLLVSVGVSVLQEATVAGNTMSQL